MELREAGEGADFRFAGGVALLALSAMLGGLGWVAGGAAGGGMAALGLGFVAFLWTRVLTPLAAVADEARTEAEELQERLVHSERHDPATGLPNARAMREHLDITLAAASRHGKRVGVARIDITGLRRIGERLGAEAREAAIRRTAGLIRMETRKGDLVARIGHSEFAVVSTMVSGPEESRAMAARLVRAIRSPFDVAGAVTETGCAAGLALADPGEGDPDKLATNAALAARAAREAGDDCALFTPELRTRFDESLQLRDELVAALDQGRIEPWFQPQVTAADGLVTGVEALARWRHPDRGVLGPAAFFPVAEEFGLMDRIDEIILERALDALTLWREAGLGAPRVGVNLAASRLSDGFLVERIKWALERRDLEPADLTVEVLESVLIDGRGGAMAEAIDKLSRFGVGVDIDDFGTGHASISALKRVKADRIKIDRSFVSGIDTDERQERCARAMIEMAKGLGVRSLAEGVETPAERLMLAALGCDEIQGFGIARPMPAEDLGEWLRAGAEARLRA